MNHVRSIAAYIGVLLIGIVLGGYLFAHVQPRSFLALNKCQNCLSSQELLGLLVAAGIQTVPGATPLIVEETDKTIAIKYPLPESRTHFVILPKKDIKDPADVSAEDQPYIMDAFAVIGDLVKKNNLVNYRVEVSGPGYQTINYLHFHLVSP
jgi:hypothetical protein